MYIVQLHVIPLQNTNLNLSQIFPHKREREEYDWREREWERELERDRERERERESEGSKHHLGQMFLVSRGDCFFHATNFKYTEGKGRRGKLNRRGNDFEVRKIAKGSFYEELLDYSCFMRSIRFNYSF